MKLCFIEKRFSAASTAMIETINNILDEYERQGYDLTLRQLYYQLVSRDLVENTERSYKNVGNLVSEARLAGLLDWEVITDRGRETVTNAHWESPQDLVRVYSRYYQVDRWKNQKNYGEVMVEKQALEGVLLPICRDYDVPFTANKGYSSSSALYEAGKRIRDKIDQGHLVTILYLGDHDPSGMDMSRDIEERITLFAHLSPNDEGFYVKRIALNMAQIQEMKPPKNPAKITDSRAAAYIQRFGRSSWELDAIEPKRLHALVKKHIEALIDWEAWDATENEQTAGRAWLAKVASK